MAKIETIVDENTRDLKYHIKRTDLLEQKTNRITYLLLLAGGTMLPTVGPSLIKLLGLL